MSWEEIFAVCVIFSIFYIINVLSQVNILFKNKYN